MAFTPNRIWKKLALGAIITVVSTLIITNIVSTRINDYYAHLSFQTDLESIANVAAFSLEEPLWNLNKETLVKICDSFFKDNAVSQIVVTDNSLGVIYNKKLDTSEHNDILLQTIEKDIIHNNSKIGSVKLSMTTHYINQKSSQDTQLHFAEMMLLIVLLTTVLSIIISRVTKPLTELEVAFKKVSEPRNTSAPQISKFGNDEIGELANNFNIMSQNISEARESIVHLNAELENKVKIRTRELSDTNSNLQTTLVELQEVQDMLIESGKMALLGELVAGVAHEINTPIGVSLTASSFIEKEVESLIKKSNNGELTKRDFHSILASISESSRGVVRNLLHAGELIASFKQVAVDQSSHSVRTFNLNQYMHEILVNLNSQFKNRNIEIVNDCDTELELTSYPGAYSQIFTNLIMNCLIHAFEKDVEGKILITAEHVDKSVIIKVIDNGKGILKSDVDKVFNPFFTTKRGSGGSGLGLNITYNIVVNILKGRIKCDSTPNEGTSFIVTVPYIHPDIDNELYISS